MPFRINIEGVKKIIGSAKKAQEKIQKDSKEFDRLRDQLTGEYPGTETDELVKKINKDKDQGNQKLQSLNKRMDKQIKEYEGRKKKNNGVIEDINKRLQISLEELQGVNEELPKMYEEERGFESKYHKIARELNKSKKRAIRDAHIDDIKILGLDEDPDVAVGNDKIVHATVSFAEYEQKLVARIDKAKSDRVTEKMSVLDRLLPEDKAKKLSLDRSEFSSQINADDGYKTDAPTFEAALSVRIIKAEETLQAAKDKILADKASDIEFIRSQGIEFTPSGNETAEELEGLINSKLEEAHAKARGEKQSAFDALEENTKNIISTYVPGNDLSSKITDNSVSLDEFKSELEKVISSAKEALKNAKNKVWDDLGEVNRGIIKTYGKDKDSKPEKDIDVENVSAEEFSEKLHQLLELSKNALKEAKRSFLKDNEAKVVMIREYVEGTDLDSIIDTKDSESMENFQAEFDKLYEQAQNNLAAKKAQLLGEKIKEVKGKNYKVGELNEKELKDKTKDHNVSMEDFQKAIEEEIQKLEEAQKAFSDAKDECYAVIEEISKLDKASGKEIKEAVDKVFNEEYDDGKAFDKALEELDKSITGIIEEVVEEAQ